MLKSQERCTLVLLNRPNFPCRARFAEGTARPKILTECIERCCTGPGLLHHVATDGVHFHRNFDCSVIENVDHRKEMARVGRTFSSRATSVG
jgi:hypothetical protein